MMSGRGPSKAPCTACSEVSREDAKWTALPRREHGKVQPMGAIGQMLSSERTAIWLDVISTTSSNRLPG